MGVKKTMDTFFASMQEQSMAGYSGRLVNTPMGPFRWNDTMQLWENVNNGMVMNNISFQDTVMMDYGTLDGGASKIQEEQFITGNLGVLTGTNGIPLTLPNTDYWAAIGNAATLLANGSAITFTKDVLIEFNRTDEGPSIPSQLFYSKNGGPKTIYSTTISMNIGDTLKVGIRSGILGDGEGYGPLQIFEAVTQKIIALVPYSYNV